MSDGGKGSRSRPFSVTSEVFSRNWDTIFNTNRILKRTKCYNCHVCLEGEVNEFNIPILATRMVLCSICGNKRCPRATDHELECTGSNQPGQPGSNYI